MNALETHPGKGAIALADEVEDGTAVTGQSAGHPVDIAGEGGMAAHRRTQRAAEGEVGMEQFRDRGFVDPVPDAVIEGLHGLAGRHGVAAARSASRARTRSRCRM